MLDLRPIHAILEATYSQFLALLFRSVVVSSFLLGTGIFEIITNLVSSATFPILLDIQLHHNLVRLSCYRFTAVQLYKL